MADPTKSTIAVTAANRFRYSISNTNKRKRLNQQVYAQYNNKSVVETSGNMRVNTAVFDVSNRLVYVLLLTVLAVVPPPIILMFHSSPYFINATIISSRTIRNKHQTTKWQSLNDKKMIVKTSPVQNYDIVGIDQLKSHEQYDDVDEFIQERAQYRSMLRNPEAYWYARRYLNKGTSSAKEIQEYPPVQRHDEVTLKMEYAMTGSIPATNDPNQNLIDVDDDGYTASSRVLMEPFQIRLAPIDEKNNPLTGYDVDAIVGTIEDILYHHLGAITIVSAPKQQQQQQQKQDGMNGDTVVDDSVIELDWIRIGNVRIEYNVESKEEKESDVNASATTNSSNSTPSATIFVEKGVVSFHYRSAKTQNSHSAMTNNPNNTSNSNNSNTSNGGNYVSSRSGSDSIDIATTATFETQQSSTSSTPMMVSSEKVNRWIREALMGTDFVVSLRLHESKTAQDGTILGAKPLEYDGIDGNYTKSLQSIRAASFVFPSGGPPMINGDDERNPNIGISGTNTNDDRNSDDETPGALVGQESNATSSVSGGLIAAWTVAAVFTATLAFYIVNSRHRRWSRAKQLRSSPIVIGKHSTLDDDDDCGDWELESNAVPTPSSIRYKFWKKYAKRNDENMHIGITTPVEDDDDDDIDSTCAPMKNNNSTKNNNNNISNNSNNSKSSHRNRRQVLMGLSFLDTAEDYDDDNMANSYDGEGVESYIGSSDCRSHRRSRSLESVPSSNGGIKSTEWTVSTETNDTKILKSIHNLGHAAGIESGEEPYARTSTLSRSQRTDDSRDMDNYIAMGHNTSNSNRSRSRSQRGNLQPPFLLTSLSACKESFELECRGVTLQKDMLKNSWLTDDQKQHRFYSSRYSRNTSSIPTDESESVLEPSYFSVEKELKRQQNQHHPARRRGRRWRHNYPSYNHRRYKNVDDDGDDDDDVDMSDDDSTRSSSILYQEDDNDSRTASDQSSMFGNDRTTILGHS